MKLIAIHGAFALLSTLLTAVSGQDVTVRTGYHRLRKQDVVHHVDASPALVNDFGAPLQDSVDKEDEEMWSRTLSEMFMSMSMVTESCVPPGVPPFVIEESVDIRASGPVPDPDGASSCGKDCYTVIDNGGAPPGFPVDLEKGDVVEFAYQTVSSNHFSIRSRACAVDCDTRIEGNNLYCGRIGLMIREDLDPLARNLYVSFSPFQMVEATRRNETGGSTVLESFSGSPDNDACYGITIVRDGDDFSFTYDREGKDECDRCVSCDDLTSTNGTVSITMPKQVLVGLAVSTPESVPGDGTTYQEFTEAKFLDIELRLGNHGSG